MNYDVWIHPIDGRVMADGVVYSSMEAYSKTLGPRTTVLVHQYVSMVYEIEVEGEVNKESVAKIMEELGYPDASDMETEKTWFYQAVPGSAGGEVTKIDL